MKHLKIAILALLLITSYSNVNAQEEGKPWMLNFGTNIIDIKDSGSDLSWGGKASLGRYLGKGFSLELAGAVNDIERPWGSGAAATFVGIDLNIKYDLNNAFGDTKWFDPYLFAGVGENWVGTENGLGLNLGLGFNAWFNDNVGLNISSGYKKVNTPVDFQMYQHSVGLVWKFNKISDEDGDGVDDKDDKCPDVFGVAENEGCPADTDKDGIEDCCDKCPDVFGLAEFDGCPDTDGDGVQDSKDKCPTVPGKKELHGCPDKDGDGVTDKDDACPDVPGPKTNAGCPFKDTDEDGVIDLIDRCVKVPGPASNEGCPEVFKDEMSVNEAAKGINFETGKADLSDEVKVILDGLATILNQPENLQFRFSINGHTDNTGSDERNLILSDQRASSVKSYLMSKGVNPARLATKGYGETSPVDTNSTSEGRLNNRRVEVIEIK